MNGTDRDTLTGLLTQRAFREYLKEAVEKNHDGALAFMDLDNFKAFNAEHGHAYGDALLKQVAETLSSNMRPGDLLGRYGGDEFIAYLPGTTSETALILMEEIRKLIEETVFLLRVQQKYLRARITLTVGIAVHPIHAETDIELLRKSDEALYRGKQDGRNRVCLPVRDERMKSKTCFYPSYQLDRLTLIAAQTRKSESFLFREALDDLIRKYTDLKEREETLLEVQLGIELLPLVDPSRGGPLLDEIRLIREDIKRESGFLLPGVRFRDDSQLKPLEYVVLIQEKEAERRELAAASDTMKDEISRNLREIFRTRVAMM